MSAFELLANWSVDVYGVEATLSIYYEILGVAPQGHSRGAPGERWGGKTTTM